MRKVGIRPLILKDKEEDMKTKFAKTLSLVLALISIVCFGFAISALTTNNDKLVYAEATIEGWGDSLEGLSVRDTLDVPETVTVNVNGVKLRPISSAIIFPDGTAKVVSPYTFSTPGKYTLHYEAIYQGEKVVVEKSFLVDESIYAFSGNNSYAEYHRAGTLTSVEAKLNDKPIKVSEAGINVALASGEYFRFNKVFNIYDGSVGKDGLIDVITAYPELDPQAPAAISASHFTVKLVDCYDDSKFVEFYYWTQLDSKGNKSIWYGGAGASTQRLCGLHQDNGTASDAVSINGFIGRLKYSDRYSTGAVWGRYDYSNVFSVFEKGGVKFKYNSKTNEAYDGENLLNDLDHPTIYPDNPLPTNFFTTGEVYVQIQFQNQNVPVANVLVTELMGLKGEELSESSAEDNVGPQIIINTEKTDAKGLNLVVGKEFEIPTATVRDIHSKGEYKVAVYYNYGSALQTMAFVKNGVLVPEKEGTYTVVYTATDDYGITNEELLNLNVVEGDAFGFAQPDITGLEAGRNNLIPGANATTINKNLVTTVTITAPDGTVKDLTSTFDGTNYHFVAEHVGKYFLSYTFSDNVYTDTYTYELTSTDIGVVYFRDAIAVPNVFIKDAVYSIDSHYGYKASAEGLTSCLADIYVKVDGGQATKLSVDDLSAYTVTANSTLTFYAQIEDDKSEEVVCNVVDVNFLETAKNYNKYFFGADEYITAATSDRFFEFGFDGVGAELLTYATPMAYNTFGVDFEIPVGNDTFTELSVIIYDIGPVANSGYKLNYISEGSKLRFTITSLDGATVYLNKLLSTTLVGIHSISVVNGELQTGEGLGITLPKLSGEAIQFAISVPQATGAFNLKVNKVANQSMGGRIREQNPVLAYVRPVATTNIGDKYELPEFSVGSAFYPMFQDNLSITLENENYEAISTVDGVLLEEAPASTDKPYVFELTNVEVYTVMFSYFNFDLPKELTIEDSMIISASDSVAPTVVFEGNVSEKTDAIEVKVGQVHQVLSYIVSDNFDQAYDLHTRVIVFDSHNNYVGWNVTEYKFNKVGDYKIGVYCIDTSGNYVLACYKIKVVA